MRKKWKGTRMLSFLLCFILAVSNVSVVHATDTVSDGDAASTPQFQRLNIDTTTQGAWEGAYGNDVAVLFGYTYPGDTAYDPNDSDGFDPNRKNYNYLQKAETVTYFNSWSWYAKTGAGGNLKAFNVMQDSVAILNMPAQEPYSLYNKIECFNVGYYGKETNWGSYLTGESATLSALSQDEDLLSDSSARIVAYKFELDDAQTYNFSIYGSGTMGNKGVIVYFLNADGTEILLKDTIDANTFDNGAYVTYQGSGSFVMVTKIVSSTDGINGFFFDTPISNVTSDLNVCEGTIARSAKLTWSEGEQAIAGAQIIVERKSTTDSIWKVIATLAIGVKEYQDQELLAGETYTYRLKLKNGNSYSENSESVTYILAEYTTTVLELDYENYTVTDTTMNLCVKATLKDQAGENIAIADLPLELTLNYGHDTQVVNAVTDSQGSAVFEFAPEYLGEAVLTVRFNDDDTNGLNHSEVTGKVFVGETSWDEEPVLWRISEGIMPGNLISLNGYGMSDVENLTVYYAKHSSGNAASEPTNEAMTLIPVNTDAVYGCYVVVQLPENADPGLYDFWVKNEYGYSNPMVLNVARALFMDEYEAWAGQTIMISGRNLQGEQFGFDSVSKVRLNDGNSVYEQTITHLSPYSMRFTVGENVPLGEYTVEVTNDNGSTWTEMESGQTLTIVQVGSDPLNLGVAWADSFKWSNTYIDVTTHGAVANDGEDDTAAFQAALDEADRQDGGVVYIPNGEYLVGNLKMPAYTVVLGESTEGTVLKYYNNTETKGGSMFVSKSEDVGIGHNGYANFSIRLYDDMIRPDGFFWFGHEWNNTYKNYIENRTAKNFFLSGIDISYPTDIDTTGTGMRGMHYSIIAKERFLVKDSSFVGFQASSGEYCASYVKYINEFRSVEKGAAFGSTGLYTFVIDCVASDPDPSSQVSNHGYMMRQTVHFENCLAEGFGNSKGVNDGEGFCVEMPGGYFELGEVVNASSNTVTCVGLDGILKEFTYNYGRPVVWIVSGRGMGQFRDIATIDYETGLILLTEDWDVIPDSTSNFTIGAPLDRVTVYNCGVSNTTKGIFMYGNGYDNVVANNYLEDTEGIFLYSSLVANDRMTPNYFTTVRDNVLVRPGVESPFLHISVGSVRLLSTKYGNKYFGTNIYGIDVRNNILVNDGTDADSMGCTEAPYTNGLVSWSTGENTSYVSDGICGDNMNIIWENNELQHFVNAIETQLGDYGFVYKGNTFKDVENILSNTNTVGTDNHVIDLESPAAVTKEILENYVSIYEKADSSTYSADAYSLLGEVLTMTMGILNKENATQSDYAFALQRLKIAASLQNIPECAEELRAVLLSEVACYQCNDADGDGKCDTCGFEIPVDGGETIEVSVNNIGAGSSNVTIDPPTDGWVEGTNTFTVSGSKACVVAVKNADGTYTSIHAVATGTSGSYSYTVTDVTADTEIVVALSGDANGDGQVNASDVTMARAASLGNVTLDNLSSMLADANGDGNINAADATLLRAVSLGSYRFAW